MTNTEGNNGEGKIGRFANAFKIQRTPMQFLKKYLFEGNFQLAQYL